MPSMLSFLLSEILVLASSMGLEAGGCARRYNDNSTGDFGHSVSPFNADNRKRDHGLERSVSLVTPKIPLKHSTSLCILSQDIMASSPQMFRSTFLQLVRRTGGLKVSQLSHNLVSYSSPNS